MSDPIENGARLVLESLKDMPEPRALRSLQKAADLLTDINAQHGGAITIEMVRNRVDPSDAQSPVLARVLAELFLVDRDFSRAAAIAKRAVKSKLGTVSGPVV